jgi:iron complex outermembrane receptor protein
VAPVTVNAFASLSPRWGLVAVELMHAGRVPVNNANTAWADSYQVVNARVAFRPQTSFALEPVVGVENIFDKTWASNVVVNAAGGRYYEPGPLRTFYVGLRMGTR